MIRVPAIILHPPTYYIFEPCPETHPARVGRYYQLKTASSTGESESGSSWLGAAGGRQPVRQPAQVAPRVQPLSRHDHQLESVL